MTDCRVVIPPNPQAQDWGHFPHFTKYYSCQNLQAVKVVEQEL